VIAFHIELSSLSTLLKDPPYKFALYRLLCGAGNFAGSRLRVGFFVPDRSLLQAGCRQ
jgi:hypothetical protein